MFCDSVWKCFLTVVFRTTGRGALVAWALGGRDLGSASISSQMDDEVSHSASLGLRFLTCKIKIINTPNAVLLQIIEIT